MRLDFICPGMPKCGTTTLYYIFLQHPSICLPKVVKEPMWLNDYELCMNRDVKWYAEHYYGISEECIQDTNSLYGEINPSFGVTSAKRLHDYFEKCKIIFILRNPVKRLWSHFNMNYNKASILLSTTDDNMLHAYGSRSKAFSKFCNKNFDRIGNEIRYIGKFNYILTQFGYAFNCNTYIKLFGRENIKIVIFEDLIKNPKEVCENLFEFLGVERGGMIDYSIQSNEGYYDAITEKERNILFDLEKKRVNVMVNGSFEEMKEILHEIELAHEKINRKTRIKEQPELECVKMLHEYFNKDKSYVENLLQRDLSDIWF